MNRIRVALFQDRAEAERARRCLAQAGIAAEIHEEPGLARFWFVSKTAAGARLEVPADQVLQAKDLLLDSDAQLGVLRSAIRCPECHSLQVDYPQFTHKSIFANLAVGLIAEIGLLQKEFYCEECHWMWAKQRTKPQRARLHMAPDYFLERSGPRRD